MTHNRRDPTQTKTLRRQYAQGLRRRYRLLRAAVIEGVGRQDRFGLAGQQTVDIDPSDPRFPERADPPDPDAEFPSGIPEGDLTDDAVIDKFIQWWERNSDSVVKGPRMAGGEQWPDQYVRYPYGKGIKDAGQHLREQGVEVTDPELASVFRMPIHRDALKILFARNLDALDGINQATGLELQRVLAEGILSGEHPTVIAGNMADRIEAIALTRATTLARTEVIRFYNEGALRRYEQFMGEDGEVKIFAEFVTAGDDRVCPVCQDLEGEVFRIKEAKGLIPVHPRCRCTWVPVERGQDVIRPEGFPEDPPTGRSFDDRRRPARQVA